MIAIEIIFELLWPNIAMSEISDQVINAVFTMQSLCLARSEFTIEAKGEGGILLLKKGAKVEGAYKETEITSLLRKLQSEVSLTDEADKIRDCMKPHIDKILDFILQTRSRGLIDRIVLQFILKEGIPIQTFVKSFLAQIILGSLSLLALAGVGIYYRYIKRRYSRERFAFFGVITLASFIVIAGLLIIRNQVRIQDTFINVVTLMTCIYTLYQLINSLYRHWNGRVSKRQINLDETGRKSNILQDAIFYTQVLFNKAKIEIYEQEEPTIYEIFLPFETDTRPWHIKAAAYLSLSDNQYDINEEIDWYRDYQCYISQYGREGEKIGVLCLEQAPTYQQLDQFLTFISSREGKFHKHIAAIAGEGEKSTEQHHGYLLEYRYEIEMLNSMILLSSYRRLINKHFEEDVLENSNLTLADIYVPVGGKLMTVEKGKLEPKDALKSVEQYILNWVKDENAKQNEHLAILGDYGQGKTVLAQKIVVEILNHPEHYNRIPILIELRGLSPRNMNELGIFGQWANHYGGSAKALWELHKTGKLFVILDGFDEMDLVGDTELLFQHFTQLWALARVPKSKILITGRPNLFADDEERRMALGIQPPRVHLPYASAIYLDKLTNEQIFQALRHTAPNTQSGILNALNETETNGSFAELITRPSTLYQLSTVWDNELENYKDRLNSAIVIRSFLEKTYDRQEQKDSTVLSANERDYFLMGIATAMMLQSGYTNQIRYKDLKQIVEQLWQSYPVRLPPYKDAMEGRRFKEPLPHRFRENPNQLEIILRDVQAGGVLVQDLSGRDVFQFAHKSYMEYLVSAFFAGFILQDENDRLILMKVNAIAHASEFTRLKLVSSPDVDRFTAEQISSQVELKDRQGNPLPIEDNKQRYAKALFYILSPYRIARWFPNITAWQLLHPYQKYFMLLYIFSIVLIFCYFLTDIKILQTTSVSIGAGLFVIWSYITCLLHTSESSSHSQFGDSYIRNMRLYIRICNMLGLPRIVLSKKLSFLLDNSVSSERYENVVTEILSCYILFSGLFVSILPGWLFSVVFVDIFKAWSSQIKESITISLFSFMPASLFVSMFIVLIFRNIAKKTFVTSGQHKNILKNMTWNMWGCTSCTIFPVLIKPELLKLRPYRALITVGVCLLVFAFFFVVNLIKLKRSLAS